LEENKFYQFKNNGWNPLLDVEFLGALEEKMPRLTALSIGGRKEVVENFKTIGRQRADMFQPIGTKAFYDPLKAAELFFKDHIRVKVDTVTHIDKGDLYKKYKLWCERTQNYNMSAARFGAFVYAKYQNVTPKNARKPEGGKRHWRCLQYVE
jgi:hypothetical protein